MKIPRLKLAKLIDERIESHDDLHALSFEIAAYLLTEGRTGELESILRDVLQLRVEKGIIEANAIDAFSLSDDIRQEIETLLKALFPRAHEIIISETHDQTLIGGTKIILPNQQLDLSIRSKLNRFNQLTTATGGV